MQVRSGMGAYAGAKRRRVHLATVLPRTRSGRRQARQARHARILQLGIYYALAINVQTECSEKPSVKFAIIVKFVRRS